MHQVPYIRRFSTSILLASSLYSFTAATAADTSVNLRLSIGNSWQTKNDIQIPNTDLGSRFSLKDEVGTGPVDAARLEVRYMLNKKHGVRVMLAPLSYTETVNFDETILFAGESFAPNQSTDATYKFNSWRLGYFYTLKNNDVLNVRAGATLKIRDAEIRLEQGDTVSFDDDIGVVPLLYLAASYRLSNRWTVSGDFDGLAGGPGRAIDVGIGLDYLIAKRWQIGAEARVLEGGADIESVYNFAQFNSASIVLSTAF